MSEEHLVNICDLRAGLKSVSALFIVLEVGEGMQTKEGHIVRTCLVADRTASVNLSVWDEWGEAIRPGHILKLTNGYASMWKGGLTLYIGRMGRLERIGEFTLLFAETPNMSETKLDSGPPPGRTSGSGDGVSQQFPPSGEIPDNNRPLYPPPPSLGRGYHYQGPPERPRYP
ncbi:SOSS complex subunit B1-like [Oscarella lobularis]|uniref:SOSS complex subunit B1-like n=1 Tax=Oscarella lobularis TaxID=121494 RepID=UPI00331446D2